MVRTQIQLTPEQSHRLKALAAQTGRSVSDLIREGVEDLLRRRHGARDTGDRRARAAAAAGRFRSGIGDLAEAHDRYLSETFDS